MLMASQFFPPLSDIIKHYCNEREQKLIDHLALPPPPDAYDYNADDAPPPEFTHNPIITDIIPGGDNNVPQIVTDAASSGEIAASGGENKNNGNGRPRRNVGSYKKGPAKIRRLPIDGKSYELAYTNDSLLEHLHPVLAITNSAHCPSTYHPNEKLQKQFLTEWYLLLDKWFQENDCCSSLVHHMPVDSWDDGTSKVYFNDIADPCILAARSATKMATDSEDTPSFDTAIHSPFQAQWWKVMYD
jgi:hypothetical protein